MNVFFKAGGSAYPPGETLRPTRFGDLAQTDRRTGRQGVLRRGDRAKAGRRHASPSGIDHLDDLKNYRAVVRAPVRGTYRGYEIVSMPPPSSGGVHLIQMLNLLETWPLGELGHNSAATIHRLAEAMKLAYADRSEYLGDPDFVKVPVAGLTSKTYARELAARIDPNRARPATDIKPGQPQRFESDQTTHYSVVDRDGNAVAVTYTLNFPYGSGIVAAGTGILLNNEMDDFAAKPGVPNAYGLSAATPTRSAPASARSVR